MKNLLFISTIIVMAITPVCAQDTEPQALQFQFNDNGTPVTRVFLPPQQTKFHLGWQWAGHTKPINDYFRINAPHITTLGSPDFSDSSLITIMGGGGGTENGTPPLYALAMQFDPAITPNMTSSFVADPFDTTGAIFGFVHKRGRRSAPGTPNYNRWIIEDSIAAGTIVLDSALPDNKLHFNMNQGGDLPSIQVDYNSKIMFLAVNLRLLSFAGNSTDTLLTIRMPYTTKNGTRDSITIDSIYTSASTSTVTSRGRVDNRTSLQGFALGANKKIFAITRSMLPSDGSDITISAKFEAGTPRTINPSLFHRSLANPIEHLGIRVVTHATGDVAIDWLRYETPNARMLFRGGYDSTIQASNQQSINSIDTVGRGVKLFRFYGIDEIGCDLWQSARYHSRLMNHGVTQETGYDYPKQYEHMVRPIEYWSGASYGTDSYTAAPFLQQGNGTPQTLGLQYGYRRFDTATRMIDPVTHSFNTTVVASQQEIFNGLYETSLLEHAPAMDPWSYNYILLPLRESDRESVRSFVTIPDIWGNTDSNWVDDFYTKKLLTHWDSFQQGYERYLYGFLKPESSADDIYYSSKPWFGQVWQTGEYVRILSSSYGAGYNGEAVVCSNQRNETGEELRLMSWSHILLGAKGLTYDRAYSYRVGLNAFGVVGFTNGKSNNESDWGEDFLNERDDTVNAVHPDYNYENHFGSYLWPYINRDTVAKYQRIDKDRIYLGRKSNRIITKGIHNWLRYNESELMRLRLVGWYAKGFRTFVNGDTADISARLRLPNLGQFTLTSPPTPEPTPSRTRPAWRTEAEPWDSAFVDYTILRDTTRGIDTVWFVGVQNRRTSPLVLSPNWGTSSSDTVRFVTTDEFNTMAILNSTKRYFQGGARNITIPFNYIDTSTTSAEWVTYHVEELHDGTLPLPGIKRIDTTIYQGRDLAINFLPGEGKMFRVTVIRPEMNPANGNLSHSNQRKLVAYPILNAAGGMVRDTVRYHMTYHKARSPKPKSGTINYGVYYKRSVPVPRTYPADMIQWEPKEFCLTDSVQKPLLIDTMDCAYPSLVVRTGSDSIARVYVVYGCRDKDVTISTQDSFVVAEHVFPANVPLLMATGTGRILARVNAPNYHDWVTPMINASRNGNYYTWSDSARGIGIGFKTAGGTNLADTSYISWEKSENRPLGIAQHPSLNSYSRITLNEDDCALVWQEKGVDSLLNRIYYTRIRMNADTILPYLARGGFFKPELSVDTNSLGTIANLSDKTMRARDQAFPIVYRGVEDYDTPFCTDLHIGHSDKVVWQGRHTVSANKTHIVLCPGFAVINPMMLLYRTVDHRDSIGAGVYLPRDWGVTATEKIWSGNRQLSQPTMSQGGTVWIPTNHTNFSDSAILINFKSTITCDPLTDLGSIWNAPTGFWSLVENSGNLTNTNLLDRVKPIVFEGQYPQLAALPGMNNINNAREWQRNRRVFEAEIEANPTILASSQYFMRSASDHPSYPFSGFAKDTVRYLVTPPAVAGKFIPLSPLKAPITKLLLPPCHGVFKGRGDFLDTITSDWIDMPSGTPITYFALGTDTSVATFRLERQATMTSVALPKPIASDVAAMDATYVIAPGEGGNYRFKLIRQDTLTQYAEELVVNELPLLDILGSRARAEQAYEDAKNRGRNSVATKGLLTCSLSPNPAQDIIRVTIQGTALHEPVRLVVSTLLGETVRVVETRTMEETEISLQGLPSGQYILRSALTRSESYDPVIIPFVIER